MRHNDVPPQLHTQQANCRNPVTPGSEPRDFWSSSTKVSTALSRIAIDNSAARNLRNAVTDRQTPYTQRGVQFRTREHALRQHSLIFAMKLARLLSTSTRKAGHTPRLPPPTRDVAAEVPRPRLHDTSSLVARENAARIRI